MLMSLLIGNFLYTDINECNGDHVCDHECTNVDGSFICSCDPGYELLSDNRTCEGFTAHILTICCYALLLL